ncbi:MAG: shikimate kinase, partial [Acidimicrobiia bacterium]|nr:shikimate kinase [Acidimicrobiia bacterium]
MRALWLVGMMGSGKTTVGELIARRTGLVFVDTDSVIEAASDRAISSIFETDGEEAFRDLEADCIDRIVATGRDCVVATGGGIVLRPQNVSAMRSNGRVVWLMAGRDELAARVDDSPARPLLFNQQTAQRLDALLVERAAAYAAA